MAEESHGHTDGDIAEIKTDIKWIRRTLEINCDWKEKAEKRMSETEKRVSALENYRSVLVGGFGLLTLLVGYGWIVPRI